MPFRALFLACLLVTVLLGPARAAVLRWSSASDIPTLDIHAQISALGSGVHAAIYESLVYYNSRTFRPEPQLATRWEALSPTQMRFYLRPHARFSDGTLVTADDVVFSLHRAMAKTSTYAIYAQGIDRAAAVDAATVDIFLKAPNPVLLNQLTELRVMSRGWAEKNKSQEPKDMRSKEEQFSHRNAMGSGPFMVKEWLPGQRLVLVRNPHWTGPALETNVLEIVYRPIQDEAARTGALASGEIDLVLDPSPQDLARLRANGRLKVVDSIENRTIFLGMDQHRDALPGLDGRNPLKDLRVRRALYQAIDVQGLARTTLGGLSQVTGALVSPQVRGWTEQAHRRLAYAPERAKRLLAEAGYPKGFEVDFICPNNRYINDAQVCQAVAAMWARIGVHARLRTMPFVTYLQALQGYEPAIYLLGWGVPTFDALYTLQALLHSVGEGGDGSFNAGRYSNPRMDALVDRAKTEPDPQVRTRLLGEALLLQNDTVAHIPLYNQVIPWVMRKGVDVPPRADNRIDWRLVQVR